MCTYVTEQAPAVGSGKGAHGWFPLTGLTTYFDHPVHAQAEHTLNIDFANSAEGPSARVAVELTAGTAIELVHSIAAVFSQVPETLTGVDPAKARRLLDAAADLVG